MVYKMSCPPAGGNLFANKIISILETPK